MLKSGHNAKQKQNFRTGMKKHKNTDSGLVQQLSLSVPTAREDLAPQVQAGCGRGEHDQVLLLQAKAAHARGWVVVARPGEDLPVDVVGVVLVLQLPHMRRESGAVPAIALVLPSAQCAVCPLGCPCIHKKMVLFLEFWLGPFIKVVL